MPFNSKWFQLKSVSIFLTIVFTTSYSLAETVISTTDLITLPYDQNVISLKADSLIPEQWLNLNNTQFIGQSIARRIFEKYEKYQDKEKTISFSFFLNSQVQLAFPVQVIKSIQKSGFLNQHQIHYTTGVYNPSMRSEIENFLADLKIEPSYSNNSFPIEDFLRPKYAYLALTKPLLEFKPKVNTNHGNVFAVLKDEVKARSTFTPFDSFKSLSVSTNVWNNIRSTFYNNSISTDFTKYAEKNNYWEVQIWGALTFSDVQFFLVNCGNESLSKNELKNVLDAASIEKPKIPVYACGVNYPGGALKPGWEIIAR